MAKLYKLVQNGKVLSEHTKKIDAIYEHLKYRRRDRVKLVEPK